MPTRQRNHLMFYNCGEVKMEDAYEILYVDHTMWFPVFFWRICSNKTIEKSWAKDCFVGEPLEYRQKCPIGLSGLPLCWNAFAFSSSFVARNRHRQQNAMNLSSFIRLADDIFNTIRSRPLCAQFAALNVSSSAGLFFLATFMRFKIHLRHCKSAHRARARTHTIVMCSD